MNSANSAPEISSSDQSVAQIPLSQNVIPTPIASTIAAPAATTAMMRGPCHSTTLATSPHYLDPSSPEYQQYYQQYFANLSGLGQAYALPQTSATTNQSHYYPMVSNEAVPGTSANISVSSNDNMTRVLSHIQASYLPTLYAATTSSSGNGVSTSGNMINDYYQFQVNNGGAGDEDQDDDDDYDDPTIAKPNQPKLSNTLHYRCNEKMGLNPLIYTNIQQSPYFKTTLFQLKTFNEVIDEIFYNVKHLEPWEKGSRKNSGQTGMCGSVRGVGAGGIISTPFCILYKLFTLRLTRKQVLAMIRHKDSPYIRALGFMYIRFTQPSHELWKWFEPYLKDDELVDPKAGGGSSMTIGEMVRHFLTKLDWFATLFPRIPRQEQLEIEKKLRNYDEQEYGRDGGGDNNNRKKTGNGNHDQDHKDHRSNNKNHHYHHNSKYNNGRSKHSRSRSRSPSIASSSSTSHKYRSKKYNDDDHRGKNFRYS